MTVSDLINPYSTRLVPELTPIHEAYKLASFQEPVTTIMQTCSSKSVSSEEDVHPLIRILETKAFWSINNKAALINFFMQKKAKFGSNAMFKKGVFGEAAKEFNKMREKGGKKTRDLCKAKWAKVCIFFQFFHICSTHILIYITS